MSRRQVRIERTRSRLLYFPKLASTIVQLRPQAILGRPYINADCDLLCGYAYCYKIIVAKNPDRRASCPARSGA